MRIVFVENDHYQAALVRSFFGRFNDIELHILRTELEFRRWLRRVPFRSPDVVILDMVLDWTSVDDYYPAPPDVIAEGTITAGLRCLDLLRGNDMTRGIPVVFYTNCNERDLEPWTSDSVKCLSKDLGDIRPLKDLVEVLVGASR